MYEKKEEKNHSIETKYAMAVVSVVTTAGIILY